MKCLSLLLCSLVCLTAQARPTVMKAAYGDFITPPAVIGDGQNAAKTGFLIDIYQQLSQQLGLELQLVSLPRQGIAGALLKQQADIYCRANPAWYPEPILRWSPPLFAYADLLISESPAIALADLVKQQARIGTVKGFRYPELERYFSSGKLQRIDSMSPQQTAELLLKKQVDAVVLAEPDAHYWLPVERLSTVAVAHYQLHCMYAPSLKPEQRRRLDFYIEQQAEQGQFRALLKQYSWQTGLSAAVKG